MYFHGDAWRPRDLQLTDTLYHARDSGEIAGEWRLSLFLDAVVVGFVFVVDVRRLEGPALDSILRDRVVRKPRDRCLVEGSPGGCDDHAELGDATGCGGHGQMPIVVGGHLESGEPHDDVRGVGEGSIKGNPLWCREYSPPVNSELAELVSCVAGHNLEPVAAVARHAAVTPNADSERELCTAGVLGRGLDPDRRLCALGPHGPDVDKVEGSEDVGGAGVGRIEVLGNDNVIHVGVAPHPNTRGDELSDSGALECHIQGLVMGGGM